MNKIVQLLQERGPSLSNDLAGILRQEGKSAEAARQTVSRLPPGVRVLHGLPFPKRARFLYLDQHFPSDVYWDALTKAIHIANPAYSAALAGVRARGGCVPARHFEAAAGSPVKQKGQVSAVTVLERLCSVELLTKMEVEGIGECILLGGEGMDSAALARMRARILTESVLLDAIRSWAGKMNLASPKATRIRDDAPAPQFATCRFDLCGPCYLRPIRGRAGEKVTPGFFVADVVVGSQLDTTAVAGFLRKCTLLGNLRKASPFLPMLIADGFTVEALRDCRSAGVIATRPETLFGHDVAVALGDLLQTLSNAAAIAAANPDRIDDLFRRLSGIEGAAGNLRGALFEMIVAHIVRATNGGSIDIGTLVRSPKTGDRAEIDVRLVREKQLYTYECKGYQPSTVVKREEVEQWLTKRIPTINAAHRAEERFSDSAMHHEFWTSGSFHPEALQLLNKAKATTTKYVIDWKDGSAVREYAKEVKSPGIRKMLDEHYFKHDLSDLTNLAIVEDLPRSA